MNTKFSSAILRGAVIVTLLIVSTFSGNAQSHLIHYWNFNTAAFSMHTDTIRGIDADMSTIDSTRAKIVYQKMTGVSSSYSTYVDTVSTTTGAPDYDTVNARLGVSSGVALRVRNPSDSMNLLFYIPTDHYKNITLKYATEGSSRSSGQLLQQFSYSTDSGTTWRTSGLSVTQDSAGTWQASTGKVIFSLVTVNFTSDTTVNNNPRLVFRVTFNGNTTGTSGNNRFDNVTVEGDTDICPYPIVAAISGPTSLSSGGSITLSDTTSGGFWSSSTASTGFATVSSTGLVSGIYAGTTTVTYSVSNSCGVTNVIYPLTISSASRLVHYWHFNNAAFALHTDTIPGIAADYSTLDTSRAKIWYREMSGVSSAYSTYEDTVTAASASPDYDTVNARFGLPPGYALRVRNPSDSMSLLFYIPTTHYKDIALKYATEGSSRSSGQLQQSFSYSTDSGATWSTTGLSVTIDSAGTWNNSTGRVVFSLVSINFTTLTSVNNNPGLVFKINFIGNNTGTSGNNRFDNVTVEGDTLILCPIPTAAAITGPISVCAGSAITLADTTSGGTWSSNDTTIATVGSGTGIVTGRSAGIDTIKYTVTDSCGSAVAVYAITVNPLPDAGTISGAASLCVMSTITLSDTTSTGSWSSTAAGIATVNSAGIVGGVSAGTDTIKYTVTNGCGSSVAVHVISINPLPDAGIISGTAVVCPTNSITLTDTTHGGSWSLTSTSVATVNPSGVVTGLAPGTDTILYIVTNSCGNDTAKKEITVSPLPVAGVITGPTSVCIGSGITLYDTAFTSYEFATLGSGFITSSAVFIDSAFISGGGGIHLVGISAGIATVKYISHSLSCGFDTAIYTVTVRSLPDPGVLTATTTSFCQGTLDTITTSGSSTSWVTSNASIASISTVLSSGVVISGISAGTAVITNHDSTSCGDSTSAITITVNPLPVAGTITGATSVCVGTNITLSDTTTGGTWSSVLTGLATISSSGVVSGVAAGSDTLKYTFTNSCGTSVARHAIIVNPLPMAGTISGSASICEGTTTTLTDTASGGSWGSVLTGIATISSSGLVSGITSGMDTLKYVVTNSCGTASASFPLYVSGVPEVGSITGVPNVCIGSTTSLGDTTAGGTWVSLNTTIATVNASTGLVSGVGSGADTIKYSVTNSCGTTSVWQVINVNVSPVVGDITGASTICAGASTTLADTTSGGAWSSSNTSVATVNSSGLVSGVSGGSDTVMYTVTYSCGTVVKTFALTINTVPSPVVTPAFTTICVGDTLSLTGSASSTTPTWHLNNTNGFITTTSGTTTSLIGNTPGMDTLTYTATNTCGSGTATKIFTINTLPGAGTISGDGSVCAGSSITLTDTTSGGTWSSVSTGLATVNASGVVSGISEGTDTIKYTVTNSCGSTVASYPVTVNPLPGAGTITGSASACPGNTFTLTDTVSGGTWTSVDTVVATISSSGDIVCVSGGVDTIKYTVTNSCGSSSAIHILSITPAPFAGIITGSATVCAGSAISLSDTASGGTWSSLHTGIATVNSAGVVLGVSAGADTIAYTVTNVCGTNFAIKSIIVNPAPYAGAIFGATSVCVASTITLSDTLAAGGTWSVRHTGLSHISGSGVDTGYSAGLDTVVYSVTNGCGTATALHAITVNPLPNAGLISGFEELCPGIADTLRDTISGGTWGSLHTGIATIGTTGIVHPITAGVDTITYSFTNICGTAVVRYPITINPLPNAGTIYGPTLICAPYSTYLDDTLASGGTWSSRDTTLATIVASGAFGEVTGVAYGLDTIVYTVTNSCGSASTSYPVVVHLAPHIGPITGPTTVCLGDSITLADSVAGGTWSVYNATSTVSISGAVHGITAGLDTVVYTVTNDCGNAYAYAHISDPGHPSAGTITGAGSVCVGSSITLADTLSGGVWSAYNSHATAGSTGTINGITVGTDTIKYVVSNACGMDSTVYTVTVVSFPVSGSITGDTVVCTGAFVSLSDTITGGVWSSLHTALASVNTGGVVTGIAPGTDTIKYIVSNACGADTSLFKIRVNLLSLPDTITGPSSVCVGATITLTDTTAGGTWTSSSTGIATITSGGVVTGAAAGMDTLMYSNVLSCGTINALHYITVNPLPNAGSITGGAATLCTGATTTFTDTVSGGTWETSPGSAGIATVSSGGVVSGIAAGTATIIYKKSNSCGADSTSVFIVISTVPSAGTISGIDSICPGDTATLRSSQPGGHWISANGTIATINSSGFVVGLATGRATIKYWVSNSCGADTASYTLYPHASCLDNVNNVQASKSTLAIFPNPNQGTCTVSISSPYNEEILLTITNMLGQTVKEQTITTNKDAEVQMNVVAGVYYITAKVKGERMVRKVVVE